MGNDRNTGETIVENVNGRHGVEAVGGVVGVAPDPRPAKAPGVPAWLENLFGVRFVATAPLDVPGWGKADPLYVAVAACTPETAGWVIDNLNTKNRPRVKRHVREIAESLASGHWTLTGQPVIFGRSGGLIDGQYRLTAIRDSGVTVPLLVVANVPDAAFRELDQHRRRSFRDVLGINGVAHPATVASAVPFVQKFMEDADFQGGVSPASLSNSARDEFLAAHPGLVEAAARVRAAGKKTRFLGGPGLATALLYVLRHADAARAEAVFERCLLDWSPSAGEEFRPARAAFEYLTNCYEKKIISVRIVAITVVKAWNAVAAGTYSARVIPKVGETFPRVEGILYVDKRPVLS